MPQLNSNSEVKKTIFLFFALTLFYIGSCYYSVIYDETEGQYAGAVREMTDSGDYLIPTNNEIPRLQKPPLTYWLMSASSYFIPNKEIAMKFPYAVACLLYLGSIYLIGKELMPPAQARIATALLAICPGTVIFGRMIMPEAFLSFFIAATFLCFIRALKAPNPYYAKRWWIASWLFMALGSFSKGLHGAAWPLLSAGICAFFSHNPSRWRGLLSWQGFLLFIIIVCPWYVWIEIQLPGFLIEHLWNEQLGHALDYRDPPTYDRVPIGIFLVQHLILLSPAILFLPATIYIWKKTPQTHELHLLLSWIFVILITSCLSARQDYYTMSMWGAVCLLTAACFTKETVSFTFIYRYFYLPLLLLFFAGVACLSGGIYSKFTQAIGPEFSSSGFRADATDQFLSVLINLPPIARENLATLMLISGGTLCVGACLGAYWVFYKKIEKCSLVWLAITLAMSGPLYGTVRGFDVMGDYFSLRQSAQTIRLSSPPYKVVYDGPLNLCSSLLFYLNQPIYTISDSPSHAINSKYDPRVLTPSLLKASWKNQEKIYLITHKKNRIAWKNLLSDAAPFYELPHGRSGERILISNFPSESDFKTTAN